MCEEPITVAVNPGIVETVAGENVELNCVVDADEDYELLGWFRNGRRLPDSSSENVLKLTNVSRDNRAYYQCLVTRRDSFAAAGGNLIDLADSFYSATDAVFLNVTRK